MEYCGVAGGKGGTVWQHRDPCLFQSLWTFAYLQSVGFDCFTISGHGQKHVFSVIIICQYILYPAGQIFISKLSHALVGHQS